MSSESLSAFENRLQHVKYEPDLSNFFRIEPIKKLISDEEASLALCKTTVTRHVAIAKSKWVS